jgi:hypothetical protein
MAANIKATLRHSHGDELESLDLQSRQLLQAPPMSEAEQRRKLAAFQRDLVEQARLMDDWARRTQTAPPFNPYG